MSRCWVFLLTFTVLLASCGSPSAFSISSKAWAYADLRVLDPVDAASPVVDLLAGYTRVRAGELQIRLDLLEMNPQPDFDLYLALDAIPGGTTSLPIQAAAGLAWDVLLVVPAYGLIKVISPQESASPLYPIPPSSLHVLRDPTLDALTISLKQASQSNVASPVTIQVFLTPAGQATIADTLGPFRSNGLPPQPAQVLFAFWNAFPAYTPAQALRRWDGAHTGPQGGRHGLYNLLRTAHAARVPITLLDLNLPAALSSLDYLGGLEMIQEMAADGLLSLPQELPGFAPQVTPTGIEAPPAWALEKAWREGRRVADDFDLPESPYIFSPAGLEAYHPLAGPNVPNAVQGIFLPASTLSPASRSYFPMQTRLLRWQSQVIIPIPDYGQTHALVPQVSEDGLSLEALHALIDTALASQSKPAADAPIAILGGDLPLSAWGNPELARQGFRYLLAHPWIRLLTPQSLLAARPSLPALPISPGEAAASSGIDAAGKYQTLLDDLLQAPDNAIGAAAWQAYLAAYTPTYPSPPALTSLRLSYLGQVGVLLEAARWAENPTPQSTCAGDPDLDGQPECILASGQIFTVFELDFGGYLASAFFLSPSGQAHQIIGPSFQLISGLSESSTWDLSQDALADPGAILGAFHDPAQPSQAHPLANPTLAADQLDLTTPPPDSGETPIQKTFRLAGGEIQIQYRGLPSGAYYATRIPLLVDPWRRFSPGWSGEYTSTATEGLTWQISSALVIEIQSQADLSLSTYSDSLRFLSAPEDPNRDYPVGHYLPFPLALVDLVASGDFTVTINLSP